MKLRLILKVLVEKWKVISNWEKIERRANDRERSKYGLDDSQLANILLVTQL